MSKTTKTKNERGGQSVFIRSSTFRLLNALRRETGKPATTLIDEGLKKLPRKPKKAQEAPTPA
jgi:hypothetical protein